MALMQFLPRLAWAAFTLALPVFVVAAEATDGALSTPTVILAVNAGDEEAGARLAERCLVCHTIGDGEGHGVGPNLFEIVGAPIASAAGFAYSNAMISLNGAGEIWTFGRLDTFLADPFAAIPGTRMGFPGIADAADRIDLIAFMRTLSLEPVPIVPVPPDPAMPPLAALTFSIEQVDRGRSLYQSAGCTACHAASLRGVVDDREPNNGDGPPLIGDPFARKWFGGDVLALYSDLRQTMPPAAPDTLGAAEYADLLAFILATIGFRVGEASLPTDPNQLSQIGFHQ